jgi:hypothetical protein
LKRIILFLFIIILISGCCSKAQVEKKLLEYKLEKVYAANYLKIKKYSDKKLEIYYQNKHDLVASKNAYKKAVKAFKKLGYDVSDAPVIIDARYILVEQFGLSDAIMYAYYDNTSHQKIVRVSRYCSDYCTSFYIMNLSSTNPDVHESVIFHELCHRFFDYLFNGRGIETVDTEYVAYTLQVKSFPPYLKHLWDEENWALNALKTEEITFEKYMEKPRSFGARMYKHHVDNPDYILSIFKKYERK